jgi:hypothetical protein
MLDTQEVKCRGYEGFRLNFEILTSKIGGGKNAAWGTV